MKDEYRYKSTMESDNSSTYGDSPKPKKSKTSQDVTFTSYWAQLPSVLLHDIFDLLDSEDRKSASAVCKHWRQHSFHPKWWPSFIFEITEGCLERAKFCNNTFGKFVSEATVLFSSLSQECMEELINLLKLFKENNNLKSLVFQPTHCRFAFPPNHIVSSNEDDPWGIIPLLMPCLPKLQEFSLGCVEDLTYFLEDILRNLDPNKVTKLGLASVKDDPSKYQASYFNPELIVPFTHLSVLSVDYDMMSDNFLAKLDSAKYLERLIAHLHSVDKNHSGATDQGWRDFKVKHPLCEFRLTVIHAFDDIKTLHNTVMRQHMPLSHLKLFFCEQVNLDLIQNLTNYADTLKSVVLVDSLSTNDNSWVFVKPLFDQSPDPFVLTAWLCKHLEEFVLYGYKYWDENLVAIGRLRGENLKKLEVAEPDIVYHQGPGLVDVLMDIPNSMQKPWKPVKCSDLHPVICNPTDGDSDEYILPIVLADLH